MENERRRQGDGEISGTSSIADGGMTGGDVTPPQPPGGGLSPGIRPVTSTKKQFYGTVTLDPIKAKMDFATIMDEVVQQFTPKLGVEVKISVEIQAQSREGFDETLQRNVKENCNVLKFDSSEFEEYE